MAHCERYHLRLIVLAVALFVCIGGGDLFAANKYQRQTSIVSHTRYPRMYHLKRGDVHASVKKIGAVKLKKSSFWNKKPFQFSTPLVTDSMLFIGVDAGVFYGIKADKMKKAWQYKTAGPVQSKAAVDGETVYFGDADGFAYALSSTDGKEIWKTQLDSAILAAPLIIGDRIYFVTESARLYALNRGSGEELMRTEPLEKSMGFSVRRASNPVYTNGLIIFGAATGALLAYRENGNLVWVKQLGERQEIVSDLDSQPLVQGGNVFVTTADKRVFCVNAATGNIVWASAEAGGPNDLAISGDKLFAAGGGVLSALTVSEGGKLWEQDFETPEISSPAVYEKIVAVVSTNEKLFLVDSDNGDIIFMRFVKKGSFGDPVFSDNRLYIISNTGLLYGFSVKEKAPKPAKKG